MKFKTKNIKSDNENPEPAIKLINDLRDSIMRLETHERPEINNNLIALLSSDINKTVILSILKMDQLKYNKNK